ncbi:MAG TPA: MarP family serine protease [Acidimicrobiia bacterium]|nr:MarP family serine protease [Acidimicrobiia bacterium]
MNFLDLVVLAVAAGAGWVGYRMGFVRRATSWAFLGVGIVVGVLLVPDVADALRGSPPRTRLLASLAFVVVVAAVAQAVGAAIGASLSGRLGRRAGALRQGDRVAGAALGVAGVLVLMWLLIPALANSPGWTARAVRDSAVARLIDRVAPAPPSESETLGRLVGDQTFPEVFDTLASPDAGAPPADGIPAEAAARVTRSTLLVEGQACDRIQEGTGFVAGPNLVVTNAHVVAGERSTRLTTSDGRRLDGTVVAFDPNRDLAIVRVPGLGLPALELGEGHIDDRGALFGHPGGGALRQAPVRIAEEIVAKGTDITRSNPTERDVFVLAAVTAPGDSGGPIVGTDGRVVGVMFAYDISRQSTAYALTRSELDAVLGPVLANRPTAPVGTGGCLAE